MKQFLCILFWYISTLQFTFADWGFLWNFRWDDTEKALRTWDVHIEDIPIILKSAINFFMGIAGTIAIIFIIVWAYKILFGSLEQDKTKWKDTIIMALTGFALASLSWFIIKIILDNFS
jgi:hypothetical protein